jgi:dihydroorotate dehydrogenase (fumarate)
MDLSTGYLGLRLPHPFLVGASPLCDSVEQVQRLAEAGAAAVVLPSLFEEQVDTEALSHHAARARRSGEVISYFPEPEACALGPDEYLSLVHRLKAAVEVPVIASLNGYSPGGWLQYAKQIDSAGADALELNLFYVATDAADSATDLEDEQLQMVQEVKRAIKIPIAVKLSPFYTSLPNFALRLQESGADGLVLFNRFYESDVDIDLLEVRPHLELSTSHELQLRLRWLSILSAAIHKDFGVSGGVHNFRDAVKAIMCGADAVQLVSALLQNGLGTLAEMRTGLSQWLEENEYASLADLRGSMDVSRVPDAKAFERANYMRTLRSWKAD